MRQGQSSAEYNGYRSDCLVRENKQAGWRKQSWFPPFYLMHFRSKKSKLWHRLEYRIDDSGIVSS
eukprot:6194833-Pleurochrysis_carterae.AAC.1